MLLSNEFTHTKVSHLQDVPNSKCESHTNLSMRTEHDEHVYKYMWGLLKIRVFKKTSHCCQPETKLQIKLLQLLTCGIYEPRVCYAIRPMVHISDRNTVKSIYCAYFHSVI